MISELMVVWGKGDKIIGFLLQLEWEWGVYLKPFCKWSRVGPFIVEAGTWYIAQIKPIKPTQMILEKIQQRSIIANGVS